MKHGQREMAKDIIILIFCQVHVIIRYKDIKCPRTETGNPGL